MPCKDTTAQITIILDEKDCLLSYDFAKLTCQKSVGGGIGFAEFCQGKHVSEVIQLEFSDLVVELGLNSSEEQFGRTILIVFRMGCFRGCSRSVSRQSTRSGYR